jgi:hypothetical protein
MLSLELNVNARSSFLVLDELHVPLRLKYRAKVVVQVVESLPRKGETLSSNPNQKGRNTGFGSSGF